MFFCIIYRTIPKKNETVETAEQIFEFFFFNYTKIYKAFRPQCFLNCGMKLKLTLKKLNLQKYLKKSNQYLS